MEFFHNPVLLNECIENLNIKSKGIYVDGTAGGGGHSVEIAKRLNNEGTLITVDRDIEAVKAVSARLKDSQCRIISFHRNFDEIKSILREERIEGIDGALLDLGVSSFQLDNEKRGFSYMRDAILDMRMDERQKLTAKDVINEYDEGELTRIFRDYGEERWASRIATFICAERERKPIETTGELVEIIKAAIPSNARRGGHHPAKKTFQAIRIEVNDELGSLKRSIDDYIDLLKTGGRLCVISFHSLEDRIVKQAYKTRLNPCTCSPGLPVCVCGKKPEICVITKKPIQASEDEKKENPRARSAKLRVCERI